MKGIPPQAGPVTLGAIGGKGWNLLRGDLTMPVAVLSRSALEHNSRWMRAFADRNGLSIAPHGKTTLAPQLFDLQARDGAWAITVSNVQQVALCREFGFDRILIANQIVGRAEIDYLFGELDRSAALELFCLVDSLEGVRRLAARARPATDRPRASASSSRSAYQAAAPARARSRRRWRSPARCARRDCRSAASRDSRAFSRRRTRSMPFSAFSPRRRSLVSARISSPPRNR